MIMKNFGIIGLLYLSVFFTSISFVSCDDSNGDGFTNETILLTENEKTDLLFMREEEKLARDVYLFLHEKHGLNIFKNIASSEQYHMDAILKILEKYGMDDPALEEIGVFTNADLQVLYNNLIAQGNTSLQDALKVGAIIEDVDIRDLDNAIETTTKIDLIEVYELLECGSRNHLRAFIGQLGSINEVYSPQFISIEAFDDIISGTHENCGG